MTDFLHRRTFLQALGASAVTQAEAVPLGRDGSSHVQPGDLGNIPNLQTPFVKLSLDKSIFARRDFETYYGGQRSGVLGSPDNTRAWTDAITDLQEYDKGGAVYLGNGRFGALSQIKIPKMLSKGLRIVGEGIGTVIDVSGVSTGAAFFVGGNSAPGGFDVSFEELQFAGHSATANSAVSMKNANGAQFKNVHFRSMLHGVSMEESYGVSFLGGQCNNVGGVTIHSSSPAHYLTIRDFRAYNAGRAAKGRFLELAQATDVVSFLSCDFEFCHQIANFAAGGSAFKVFNSYIENCTSDPFGFGGPMYGASITDSLLALGTSFAFQNWKGGEYRRIYQYNQVVAFASTCEHVNTDAPHLLGTSTFTGCPTSPVTLLNSATAVTTPGYFRDDTGNVQLTGRVLLGGEGNGKPIFQLPAAHWPSVNQRMVVLNDVNNTIGTLVVDASNGNVVPIMTSGANVSLDGVSFRAS